MKRTLFASLLIGLSGTAAAAEGTAPAINYGTQASVASNILDGAEPGTITVAGITVYGAVDTNLAWQSHGVHNTGSYYNGMEYQINKNSRGEQFALTNNALQVSFIGLKGNQSLADLTGLPSLAGTSLVFDLQAGFNPVFGAVSDNLRSLRDNNGVAAQSQTANGDGARAGQIFNGEAYAGLKNEVLGELRFGRNNSVLFDAVSIYDPQKLSYANSLLSSGTYGGGYGATEDTRWNNSFKYKNTIGVVRVAAQYRFEGTGQGGEGYTFGGGVDVPGALKGLSIDGVWGREKDAISASSLTSSTSKTPAPGSCQSLGVSPGACVGLNVLSATVSDNTAWAIMAKYNFEKLNLANLTVFGGYEHIDYANPSSQLSSLNGIGGYSFDPTGVNYQAYVTDRQQNVVWIAGQYYFNPKLSLTGSWYHLEQGNYQTFSLGKKTATGCTSPGQGVSSQSNCAGSLDWSSALIDYQWTQRLDVYAGISYTQVQDGLAAGFIHTSTVNPTIGARFRF